LVNNHPFLKESIEYRVYSKNKNQEKTVSSQERKRKEIFKIVKESIEYRVYSKNKNQEKTVSRKNKNKERIVSRK